MIINFFIKYNKTGLCLLIRPSNFLLSSSMRNEVIVSSIKVTGCSTHPHG